MENNNNPLSRSALRSLFEADKIELTDKSETSNVGEVTEQDKLLAAKQILFGLAFLFFITIIAYLFRPEQGAVLLDICKTSLPPLATLIIAFYFNNKKS